MPKLFANLSLLVITLIWGISFPLIRNAVDDMPDTTYLFLRFFVAALILIPILLFRRSSIRISVMIRGFFLGICLFLVIYLTANALLYTSGVNVSFFTGLGVILVPILWVIYHKSMLERNQLISVFVSMFGIYLLIGGVNLQFNFGDFLGLLLAISVALQILVTDLFCKKEDPLTLGIFQIIFCAIFSSGYWAVDDFPMVPFSTSIVVALFVTGVLGTALAFTIQTVAQKYTTPTQTALIFSCEPVFGAIFSTLIAKNDGSYEILTVTQAIGCALIFTAILLSEKSIVLYLTGKFKRKS